jgi:hypothetical protein
LRIVRVFTGDDKASHFEELDIPLDSSAYGQFFSEPVPVQSVIFRETPAGGLLDFHPAPRRQFVITLEGVVEIECGDGAKLRLGAGDILLADDLTGQGHISREIEGPRRSIFLPLAEDFDVSRWRR